MPAAPGDCGQVVGILWAIHPPDPFIHSSFNKRSAFVGPALFDISQLPKYLHAHGGKPASIGSLAFELVHKGSVVGVARGRSEWGPRALGHRSLLAYGGAMDVKARLNKIKHRQWFRPVAPILLYEDAAEWLETDSALHSPYMSFAVRLQPWVLPLFPDIAHVDSTARIQTVMPDDDAWLYALLCNIKKHTGYAVLVNTSFNEKGILLLIDRIRLVKYAKFA